MHELSVASAIADTVVRHAAGRRVDVVWLRIGRLRQVVLPTLEFYWQIVARDTVCEDSRLEIEDVPAVLRCGGCEQEWEIVVPAFVCPRCGPQEVSVVSGEELSVESLDVQTEQEVA